MNNKHILILIAANVLLAGCSSSSSSSGGGGEDASRCVDRTLNTFYSNTCDYDVNVLILKEGERVFKIDADDVSTRTVNRTPFGACRAPSEPVPTADFSTYSCS